MSRSNLNLYDEREPLLSGHHVVTIEQPTAIEPPKKFSGVEDLIDRISGYLEKKELLDLRLINKKYQHAVNINFLRVVTSELCKDLSDALSEIPHLQSDYLRTGDDDRLRVRIDLEGVKNLTDFLKKDKDNADNIFNSLFFNNSNLQSDNDLKKASDVFMSLCKTIATDPHTNKNYFNKNYFAFSFLAIGVVIFIISLSLQKYVSFTVNVVDCSLSFLSMIFSISCSIKKPPPKNEVRFTLSTVNMFKKVCDTLKAQIDCGKSSGFVQTTRASPLQTQ